MNKHSDEYGDYLMDEQEDRFLLAQFIKNNPNSPEAIYQRNEDARFEAECKREDAAEALYEKKEKIRLRGLEAMQEGESYIDEKRNLIVVVGKPFNNVKTF